MPDIPIISFLYLPAPIAHMLPGLGLLNLYLFGHLADTFEESFFSRNANGRYIVLFYSPYQAKSWQINEFDYKAFNIEID